MKKIKFSIPNINIQDVKLVKEIIRSGWLTQGKFTNLFEKENKQLIVELKYPTNLNPQEFNNFLDLPIRLSRNSKYVEGFNYKR